MFSIQKRSSDTIAKHVMSHSACRSVAKRVVGTNFTTLLPGRGNNGLNFFLTGHI